MNPRRWLLVVACQCGAALAVSAQTPPAPEHASVKDELAKLIREDAAVRYPSLQAVEAPPGENYAEETLKLPTFIVREKRRPAPPPSLKETTLQEFFRTGTIFETRKGIKLWIKGDKGLMLTIPF